MEELTVEEITEEVQRLKKALNDAEAKIDVWKQNLDTVKTEYEELKKKCKDEYNCSPQQLSALLETTKAEANELLAKAVEEYDNLVNANGDK